MVLHCWVVLNVDVDEGKLEKKLGGVVLLYLSMKNDCISELGTFDSARAISWSLTPARPIKL
jgi:hypothetical protein